MSAPRACGFDLSLMSDAEKRNLFSDTLAAVRQFYADPVNKKRFEDWKSEQIQNNNLSGG
jgi:hypothetical protein